MKVIEEKFEVESGGDLIEVGAAIKATSKAFQVLSSNLYSDKILAIVRELSCNAWDSHVSAGKNDTPIEIHLPTALDTTFHVKDFGLGMSDFDIRGGYVAPDDTRVSHEEGRGKEGYRIFHGIYTTFFDSTKTDSNEVIGQLGLGSKSPYAYANTFTVESRFNGEKRIYTCYKNTGGEPAITLLDTSETEESNGMTVTMAVAKVDITKFAEAARKALMYFNPKPNVLGQRVTPYKLEHTIEGTNWKVRNTDYFASMTGAYVVQGFVAYPIDVFQLEQNGLDSVAAILARANIDFFVPIGQVEVAPSREALSYDQRTIKNIIASLNVAAAEVRDSFQKRIDTCTSRWEMMQLYDTLMRDGDNQMRGLFAQLSGQERFKWKGEVISQKATLDLEEIEHTSVAICTLLARKGEPRIKIKGQWAPNEINKSFEFALQANMHVLCDSQLTGTNSTIARFLRDTPAKNGREPLVILLRPLVKGGMNMPEMFSIIEMLGDPEPIYVDDLPAPFRAKKSYYIPVSARSRAQASSYPVFKGFEKRVSRASRSWNRTTHVVRKFTRKCWETKLIDLAAGGIYFPVVKNEIMNGLHADFNVDSTIASAIALNLIKPDTDLVGFTDKESAKLDPTKWVDFYDFVKEQFIKKYVTTNKLTAVDSARRTQKVVPAKFIDAIERMKPRLVDGVFKDIVDRTSELLVTADTETSDHAYQLVSKFGIQIPADVRPEKLQSDFNNLNQTYKHIGMFEWGSYFTEPALHAMLAYVKEVDMKRAAQAVMHARTEMTEEVEQSE